ncbi:hypothetical protein OROMI_011264 [Orobanche minor]
MSQDDVSYSCCCGYHLNLTSSSPVASNINSKHSKSVKKGFISVTSIDPSRFTQVDKLHCLPLPWRPKSELLCRKCEKTIGYGYGDWTALCGLGSLPTSSGSSYKKIVVKILALRPPPSVSNYGEYPNKPLDICRPTSR